jgi:hypothetical protein
MLLSPPSTAPAGTLRRRFGGRLPRRFTGRFRGRFRLRRAARDPAPRLASRRSGGAEINPLRLAQNSRSTLAPQPRLDGSPVTIALGASMIATPPARQRSSLRRRPLGHPGSPAPIALGATAITSAPATQRLLLTAPPAKKAAGLRPRMGQVDAEWAEDGGWAGVQSRRWPHCSCRCGKAHGEKGRRAAARPGGQSRRSAPCSRMRSNRQTAAVNGGAAAHPLRLALRLGVQIALARADIPAHQKVAQPILVVPLPPRRPRSHSARPRSPRRRRHGGPPPNRHGGCVAPPPMGGPVRPLGALSTVELRSSDQGSGR